MDLHREVLPAPERAADACEVDPHLLFRQPQARRDLVAVDVEPLRRDVDVDAALAVRNGQARLRAEERLILDPELVVALDRDLAFGIRVAAGDPHVPHDVGPRVVAVAVPLRPALRVDPGLVGRTLGIDHELELLVLDLDRGRRPPRLLRMLGGDEGDRLAEVAHPVEREHGLVGELEPVALVAGDVLVGEDGMDARHADGLRDVDRDDGCVRMRRPHRVAPEHPGREEVARVRELAGDLRDPVDALDRLADPAELELPRRRGAHANSFLTSVSIWA